MIERPPSHPAVPAPRIGVLLVNLGTPDAPEPGPVRRYLREFRLDDAASYEVGQVVKADVFAEGDKIDITGTSKGHGFTGVIYRWNQSKGPATHGSKYHRGPGAMAANTDPGKVFKGRHMSGHYGVDRVTVQNLEVIGVDAERILPHP